MPSQSDGRIREQRMEHGTVRTLVTDRGRHYTHHECKRRLGSAAHDVMRWFSRAVRTRSEWNEADMRAADLRDLRLVLDDLASYVEIAQRELDRIEGVDRTAERVKALRQIEGRTPDEAAAFLAKADQIEREACDVV